MLGGGLPGGLGGCTHVAEGFLHFPSHHGHGRWVRGWTGLAGGIAGDGGGGGVGWDWSHASFPHFLPFLSLSLSLSSSPSPYLFILIIIFLHAFLPPSPLLLPLYFLISRSHSFRHHARVCAPRGISPPAPPPAFIAHNLLSPLFALQHSCDISRCVNNVFSFLGLSLSLFENNTHYTLPRLLSCYAGLL